MNKDRSYAIRFEDGDVEQRVVRSRVEVVSISSVSCVSRNRVQQTTSLVQPGSIVCWMLQEIALLRRMVLFCPAGSGEG